jgi:hypothetical protein
MHCAIMCTKLRTLTLHSAGFLLSLQHFWTSSCSVLHLSIASPETSYQNNHVSDKLITWKRNFHLRCCCPFVNRCSYNLFCLYNLFVCGSLFMSSPIKQWEWINSVFGWLWFFLLDVNILSKYLCQVISKSSDICVSFIWLWDTWELRLVKYLNRIWCSASLVAGNIYMGWWPCQCPTWEIRSARCSPPIRTKL